MIQAFFLGVLFIPTLSVLPGCKSGPPTDLIIRNDHRGLAEWYEHQAIQLRSKADEMRHMVKEYDNPFFRPSPKETKQELIAHCETFINYYTQAAAEADVLAKIHRQEDKAIP